MTTATLEAFDTLAWSTTTLERLEAAQAELGKKQGLKDEKAWLTAAIEKVQSAREGLGDVQDRAMRLPELEPLREEFARGLQGTVIDAVERLLAGITFTAGSRAPLLEALSARLKLPPLRRAMKADFEDFCVDFEKRLNSGYAKRMLAEPAFAPIAPAVEQVRATIATWRAGFTPAPLPDEEARALRDELDALSRRLDLPMRQARLLAEAALAPLKNAFEESGLGAKPRRRAVKAAVTESAVAEAPAAADEAPAEAAPAEVQAATEAPAAEAATEAKPPKAKRAKKTEPRDTP